MGDKGGKKSPCCVNRGTLYVLYLLRPCKENASSVNCIIASEHNISEIQKCWRRHYSSHGSFAQSDSHREEEEEEEKKRFHEKKRNLDSVCS